MTEGPGIIVGRKGSIGEVVWSESNFWTIDTAYFIKKRTELSLRWIYYFLIFLNLKNLNSATGIPGLNRNDVYNLSFPIPPLQEQQKIACILSNVDILIQKTDQVIRQTQILKKGLMQRLLTKGIGHTKFKKTELGEIPEEWKSEKIFENSILKGRIGWQGLTTAEYREQGEFYLVTGTDFKYGRIDWKNCVYVDKVRYIQDENIQLKKDDVLVTKDGTIGKIAYIDILPQFATLNTGIFVIRPIKKNYVPFFLYYVLLSNYFIKFLNRLKAGSTINHLYQKDFINFSFPIPPLKEQQEIASILSNVDNLIQKLKDKKKTEEILKKGLMQQLLTGRIRVKV
ncbi:MAG: restriction endonuclease subunit S [Candidatus Nitrosocosmicus sp.]|nr:restriction endonuclease subunit S [Candidatus Nitrosocosmicus sp.]MDN5867120.1 restriction endonuclease subunit S [Candidatus Nitrosocosmicus sp.]